MSQNVKKSVHLLTAVLLMASAWSATLLVPAVDQDMDGVLVELTCEVMPGEGRVLVTTDPYIGVGTQASERDARRAVEQMMGEDALTGKDVVFILSANDTSTIDGGSAGLAMGICLLAELQNQSLAKGVSVTGAIDQESNAVQVSGILQKARAASSFARVFVVPAGQQTILTYTKSFTTPREGIYIEEVQPLEINITEYASRNWNLSVVEVSDLSGAYSWFMEDVEPRARLDFGLPDFERPLPQVEALAERAVERAEGMVGASNQSLAGTYLAQALNVPDGYPYTKANFAFLASVAGQTSLEDVETIARELLKQMNNFPTSQPYWRAEAEMRLSWALFKEDNFAAQKDWLIIAAHMLSMERPGNETVSLNQVKKTADGKIVEAKAALEEAKVLGGSVSEAEASLELAIESFEEDMYFAALYNALDAMAWAEAYKGADHAYLARLLEDPKEHEFPEAYRRHAIYLLNQDGGDGGLLEPALFSAYRADVREGVFEDLEGLPIDFQWPGLDWKLIALALLSAYFIKTRFIDQKKKGPASELSDEEMMVLAESRGKAVAVLQEKMKNGEIDRETYVKLVRELEDL